MNNINESYNFIKQLFDDDRIIIKDIEIKKVFILQIIIFDFKGQKNYIDINLDYNKENKRNIFNLLSDLLKKNKNLYEISDIMNGYVYNQSIENNLDRIKDDENNLVSWNFLTKNGKKEVFDGTTLGNITKEYNNYYINLNGNIIPKCFIDNEENIAAYFALKEIKGEENSFLKFKWISQSQNNILCSFLNEWHLFDFVFDDNNYIKQNDYIRQKDSLVFLKNNNLLDPNQNLIFDSGSSFYIINLKKILNKSKMYQIISDDNTIKLRTLNFNSDLIINLVESLIDDDEERITNKAFDYFIKMNIKNKNIKISNDGFKKFLKRKYNF